MESPDEIGSDEVAELTSLVQNLESRIQNFSFTGENVSGDIETGFIVNQAEDEE